MCNVSLYNAPNQHGKQNHSIGTDKTSSCVGFSLDVALICLFEKFTLTPQKKSHKITQV